MKYIDEYRDAKMAEDYARAISAVTTKPWTLMEVCGGQTHAIVKFGIEELLPGQIALAHGPGCPVCVTPVELIDKAIEIASRPDVIFCSFGDMLRVPGTRKDLFVVKAGGGDVRVVYSPLDCLKVARENPDKQVVFFAVGFETTAPANAMAVYQAHQQGVTNFSILVSHVLVPPAMEAILSSPSNRVQGFLAAGHVCTVMGYAEYEPIAAKYHVPIVVTGFEPLDILQGVLMCVKQLEEGRAEAANVLIRIDENSIPVREDVQGACEILGFDPLYLANEGRFVAFVAAPAARRALDILGSHPLGKGACLIGKVTNDSSPAVVMRSRIGATRIVDMLSGEQLPRIC